MKEICYYFVRGMCGNVSPKIWTVRLAVFRRVKEDGTWNDRRMLLTLSVPTDYCVRRNEHGPDILVDYSTARKILEWTILKTCSWRGGRLKKKSIIVLLSRKNWQRAGQIFDFLSLAPKELKAVFFLLCTRLNYLAVCPLPHPPPPPPHRHPTLWLTTDYFSDRHKTETLHAMCSTV